MKVYPATLALMIISAISVGSANAASIAVSIGIRETGGTGPKFSNAGATGGIEFVNLDGQSLVADGTWQQFTFTPSTDALTAFAGATANGVLDTDWVSLDAVRLRNIDGITVPIRLWIDNFSNTDAAGTTTEGFESSTTGTEVIFQEPNFSGSTSANLVAGGTSLVSESMAFAGTKSNESNFQFIDANNTRWVRLTTFNTPNLPNIALHAREPGAPAPTITFYAKALVVPEPGTAALAVLALLGLAAVARRAD